MKADPTATPDLVHASHVRLAYRAILGREASPEEVRIQLAGLRTTAELLHVLTSSAEFTGQARVLLDPKPAPTLVNVWHPDFQAWTHRPGTVSADGVAVAGEEGWLFVQGGSNATLAQFTGELQMSDGWSTSWKALMEHRSAEAARIGVDSVSLVVPDKLAVMADRFPERLQPTGPRPVERLLDELQLPIVYPLAELQAARAEHDVYLRTDSHYSPAGNYVIHEAVALALGAKPVPRTVLDDAQAYVASGDLGRKFDPHVVEVMRSMPSLGDATIAEDNRDIVASTGGHIGSRRVFHNPTAPDDRVAVLFGDSYGFASLGHEGLAWYLAQMFRELHFIWTPFGWDSGYAQRAGAGVVVSQTAERFIARVPAKSVDVDELVRRAVAATGAISPDTVFDDPSLPGQP